MDVKSFCLLSLCYVVTTCLTTGNPMRAEMKVTSEENCGVVLSLFDLLFVHLSFRWSSHSYFFHWNTQRGCYPLPAWLRSQGHQVFPFPLPSHLCRPWITITHIHTTNTTPCSPQGSVSTHTGPVISFLQSSPLLSCLWPWWYQVSVVRKKQQVRRSSTSSTDQCRYRCLFLPGITTNPYGLSPLWSHH